MSSIIKGLQNEQNDFQVNVPGYGTVPLEMLKRHVKELAKDFNDMIQSEEFIKAAYKTEQFYNALFALSKAMKEKSVEEGYSAGITGGSGLGIEKSPMEKVIEKPLGEKINTPGGMGQSYRKFTPKSAGTNEEQLNELSPETLARYKKAAGADASKADKEGDFERGNKRFSGIVRATKKEFDKPTKESSIMKGLQAEEKVEEYGEVVPGQRKIVFNKENKPDMYYLYQQFIQRMLNPENQVDPFKWIDEVNKYYDLNYSWKDYQKRGHNDQTNNWQKIVNKYIVNKK